MNLWSFQSHSWQEYRFWIFPFLLHWWVLIPFVGIKLQATHLLKKPLSHLEYPHNFLFDFLRVHTLALTNKSFRFFPLLYATTEGFGKILWSLGSSSAITFQCFLTIFEMEGRLGWNFVTKGVFWSLTFSTFSRAFFLSIFLIFSKASFMIFGW